MKNLKFRKLNLLYLVLVAGLISCVSQPIDNFKGAIIHGKDAPPVGKRYLIEIHKEDTQETTLKTVYVSDYDYEKYKAGDTIKQACH